MASKAIESKIVVLGDKGVGKTCLVMRFIEGIFTPKQQSTIGAFFLTKKLTSSNGTTVKMQIWDTAGQERFRAMAPMYYRGAAAAVVCYDITDAESFEKMKDWIDELRKNVAEDSIILAIACNKSDLGESRTVSSEDAGEYAKEVNALLFETSAKENKGIEDLFATLADKIVRRKLMLESSRAESSSPSVDLSTAASTSSMRSSSCC